MIVASEPSTPAKPERGSRGPSGPARVPHSRTCVGCGKPEEPGLRARAGARTRGGEPPVSGRPLVRLVLEKAPGADHTDLAVDAGDGRFGRGAHVHAELPCLRAAASRGLLRAARGEVWLAGEKVTSESLALAVKDAFERRVVGLLTAARRAKKLEVGSEACLSCLRQGRASLVVLAGDAAAAAELSEVRRAREQGLVIVWGNKASLAHDALGQTRDAGVAIVAVSDSRIAAALRQSRMVVDTMGALDAPSAGETRARRAASLPAPDATGSVPGASVVASGDAQACGASSRLEVSAGVGPAHSEGPRTGRKNA